MPPQLVAMTEGPSILLDKPILLLGRNPECDIQIESRKISRRHCCIAQVNDYLVVRDLGSTNGIRINGVRVLEGRLKPGDEITIGNQRYQVRWDPLESAGRVVPIRAEPEYLRPGTLPVDEDDDMLESCEEPIPLQDPEGTPRAMPFAASVPGATALPPPKPAALPPPASVPSDPLVIPEDVNLAPFSDIIARKPEKSPPAP